MKPWPKKLSQKPLTSLRKRLSNRKLRSLNLLRLKRRRWLLRKRLLFPNRWLNLHQRRSRSLRLNLLSRLRR